MVFSMVVKSLRIVYIRLAVGERAGQNGKAFDACYAKTDHMQSLMLINTYEDTATLLRVPPNMPSL